MALIAMAMPILPGKRAKWQEMMDRLQNDTDLKASMARTRSEVGVRERTFLQETPDGNGLVIVTLEGENPLEAFGKIASDPAMADFMEWAKDVHGLDPTAGPPPEPRLVWDSGE